MAWVERRGKRFRLLFRMNGEKYTVGLKVTDQKAADACLARVEENLIIIRDNAALVGSPPDQLNRSYSWNIPNHLSLRTKASKSYERGKREGGLEVVGELTAVWGITSDPKKSSRDIPKQFRLTGNASVVVRWIEVGTQEPIGQWNVDVGAADSPGCMFHIQYPGIEIPVPRHPGIAFSPMAVAEHLVGELFQDEWERHSRINSPEMESWRGIQKQRLTRLFEWQYSVLKNCNCPPWTALKNIAERPFPDGELGFAEVFSSADMVYHLNLELQVHAHIAPAYRSS